MLSTCRPGQWEAGGNFDTHGSPDFPEADLRRTVFVLTERPTPGRRYNGVAIAARALGSNFAVLTFA
jgi:hypothetical protein